MAAEQPTSDEALDETPPARLGRKTFIALGAVGTAATLGLVFYITGEVSPPPEKLFAESLSLLDDGDVRRAGNIARYLKDEGYRDINFGGGVDFVLGMSEFELGAKYSVDQHTSRQHFEEAANNLKVAFDQGLLLKRRPRWAYAHGMTLYELGRLAEAEPRLIEALAEYEPGRYPVSLALAHCDLCASVRSPERLTRTIGLMDEILADSEADESERSEAWLLRAEASIYHDGAQAAEKWISVVTPPEPLEGDGRLTLVRAKVVEALGDHTSAGVIYQAVLADSSASPELQREAAYRLAALFQSYGDDEEAIELFRKVVDDFDKGDETPIAAVRLGELLRVPPRSLYEDSLRVYRVAVEIDVDHPELFRNRYVSLEEMRDSVRQAWQDWLNLGEYKWAILLAEQMAPLFIKTDAAAMAAAATESQANALASRLLDATETQRKLLEPDVLEAWRGSGRAYSRLADVQLAQSAYADAVWTSADHFMRGHDYEAAKLQTERFLQSGTESRRPNAMVNLGRLQMNLHRHGEDDLLERAAATFERMLADYPTADAAFDARFALGECYLELDDPDRAEQQWRQILESDVLSPTSVVWQDALAATGDMHFHVGERLALSAREAATNGQARFARERKLEADRYWRSAISELSAFLARSPKTERTSIARFWLAKALQRSIENPKAQLDQAETNNARLELERQIRTALGTAISELRRLQDRLTQLNEGDELGPLGRRILRDSTFEIAHTYFLLGDYSSAIDSYSAAVNSYPNDPQVLLAYLQSARCYDRLGRARDAQSQLKRAKIIQSQLAPEVYQEALTNFRAQEWENFLTRTLELLETNELKLDSATAGSS